MNEKKINISDTASEDWLRELRKKAPKGDEADRPRTEKLNKPHVEKKSLA